MKIILLHIIMVLVYKQPCCQVGYNLHVTTAPFHVLEDVEPIYHAVENNPRHDLGFDFPFDGNKIREVYLDEQGIYFRYGNHLAFLCSHLFAKDTFELISIQYYLESRKRQGIFEFYGFAAADLIRVQIILEYNGRISYIYARPSGPAQLATVIHCGIEVCDITQSHKQELQSAVYFLGLEGSPEKPTTGKQDSCHGLTCFPPNGTCYRFSPTLDPSCGHDDMFYTLSVKDQVLTVYNHAGKGQKQTYTLRDERGNLVDFGEFDLPSREIPINERSYYYTLELECGENKRVMKINL